MLDVLSVQHLSNMQSLMKLLQDSTADPYQGGRVTGLTDPIAARDLAPARPALRRLILLSRRPSLFCISVSKSEAFLFVFSSGTFPVVDKNYIHKRECEDCFSVCGQV